MFRKICYSLMLAVTTVAGCLSAEIKYEIQDIGTLQTRSSKAISINNQGQILGWYNIDGTEKGKHYFVRDKDGSFHEIVEDQSIVYEDVPQQFRTMRVDWRFLTDDGRVYGTFNMNPDFPVLFMWDLNTGLVKLGKLPGKVSTINNTGKVLIKSVANYDSGKEVRYPVIWDHGKITKLKGLEGNVGIESDESYGFDMNNKDEVVGQSLVYISYKNDLYRQVHATKWVNGKAIDLHAKLPKAISSCAYAINDCGEVCLNANRFLNENGELVFYYNGINNVKTTSKNYIYDLDTGGNCGMFDKKGNKVIDNSAIANIMFYDTNSIWLNVIGIVGANDNAELIVQGKTIYGEEHAMFLTPVKPE